MEAEREESQNQVQFESLIQGLLENDFGCCDDFLNTATVKGLREKLIGFDADGEMQKAGIGQGKALQTNEKIRGDEIKWIEKDSVNHFEEIYLKKVAAFILYLNTTCYTSLGQHESHYASYPIESFYKRHKDQFRRDSKRKFSIVLYLNENWLLADGGGLSLYFGAHREKEIMPLGGRMVFFRSDRIEHEVHPSHTRVRRSIAGWLKSS